MSRVLTRAIWVLHFVGKTSYNFWCECHTMLRLSQGDVTMVKIRGNCTIKQEERRKWFETSWGQQMWGKRRWRRCWCSGIRDEKMVFMYRKYENDCSHLNSPSEYCWLLNVDVGPVRCLSCVITIPRLGFCLSLAVLKTYRKPTCHCLATVRYLHSTEEIIYLQLPV